MSLVTFLLYLLDVGKVQGKVQDAAIWLLSIFKDVRAKLPPDAADYIGPVADRLAAELGTAAANLDLRAIVQEFAQFVETLGGGLEPPDPRAGLGV